MNPPGCAHRAITLLPFAVSFFCSAVVNTELASFVCLYRILKGYVNHPVRFQAEYDPNVPASAAADHATSVSTEASAILAEVLRLQITPREVPCSTGMVHHACLAIHIRSLFQERVQLFHQQKVGKVVRLPAPLPVTH